MSLYYPRLLLLKGQLRLAFMFRFCITSVDVLHNKKYNTFFNSTCVVHLILKDYKNTYAVVFFVVSEIKSGFKRLLVGLSVQNKIVIKTISNNFVAGQL